MTPLPRTDHTYTHRVRFRECDPMGVVYHAHCIDWFEAARTEGLRNLGRTYREMQDGGTSMPVLDLGASYLRPLYYDDLVEVDVMWTLNDSRTRIRFDYRVRRSGDATICIGGHVTLCFVDAGRGRPVRAPQELVDLVSAP